MNRISEIELGGVKYPLNFSVKAAELFDEKFGGLENIEEALSAMKAREALRAVCWMLSVLIAQGAAYRRIVDKVQDAPCISEDDLAVVIGAAELPDLQARLYAAMAGGSATTVEVELDPKNVEATPAG